MHSTEIASTADHPYAAFVHRVTKPARYLGGEAGQRPKPWATVRSRVCLAFPDIYDIGMSHLGYKILYKILNDHADVLAERVFCPWVDMEAELRTRGLPLLSLESAKPLSSFDVVGFSLQFELTYTNILTMLDLGGVPLRAADRGEEDPLVLAGGPSATHPEPVAPFFDAIVIGDGEECFVELALAWADLKAKGASRAERLKRLASIRGVYVPSLYTASEDADTGFLVVDAPSDPSVPMPVVRTYVADLNRFPFPDDGPVGGPEAIFDRMSIEIARGCTEGCRFCQAGMIYRPVRERDPEAVVETLVSAIKKAGYDEASLTSLSTADYSCIAPLVKKVTERLAPENVSLGVSSLRAYGLDESVLDDLQRVRASGVTFAPEAGSQRMRDVINKNVTEEQLMTTASRIFSRGWTAMKLYFMIGLPTEEEEDVREIARVGGRARDVGKRIWSERRQHGAPKITVSVSTHVPKPHTPFQWCAMDSADIVRQKQEWLREEARAQRVDLRMHDSDTSWLEGVFARGDRRLADVLERAYRRGARFDSWEDQKKLDVWEEAFAHFGIDTARYLGTIPVSGRLPWDHIDVGLEGGFLLKEYRKALKSRLSPPCGKAVGMFVHHTNKEDALADRRKLVCYDCGVACDLGEMRAERIRFLDKMGAERRLVAAAPETEVSAYASVEAPTGDPPREPAPTAPVRRRPPIKHRSAGERTYRLQFTKLGPSAYLGHLDMTRSLPRAFRRLSLPLVYSGGFHPKPELVFAPALSLGVASLEEYVDVRLDLDADPAPWLAELNEGMPRGMAFTGAKRLGASDVSLSKCIDGARYALAIPMDAAAELGGSSGLQTRIDRLKEAAEAIVLREAKAGLRKKVDVRAYLRDMEMGALAERSLVAAGLVGERVAVQVDMRITDGGAAKISEVAEVLLGAEVPFRAVRVALGTWADSGELLSPLVARAPSVATAANVDAAAASVDATAAE